MASFDRSSRLFRVWSSWAGTRVGVWTVKTTVESIVWFGFLSPAEKSYPPTRPGDPYYFLSKGDNKCNVSDHFFGYFGQESSRKKRKIYVGNK